MNKIVLSACLTPFLVACGGGGSGDSGGGQPAPPAVVQTQVSGVAVKGTLSNASVSVFKYVNGEPVALSSEEIRESNITTSEDGSYSFTLLNYSGPVKIELSPSTDSANPTTMVCDASIGCGDVAFGETINITSTDPDFTLSALSVVDGTTVTVNVSSLTHMASALTESDSNGVNAVSIQQHASVIANTFGIQGNITELAPTKIDDLSEVASESNDAELRYGLINAGIASAIFSNEGDTQSVLSNKFEQIVADLVANNGALLIEPDNDGTFELSVTDVLNRAIATSTSIQRRVVGASSTIDNGTELIAQFSQISTVFENRRVAQIAVADAGGRSQVVSDIATDGDAIAKATAMVEDVRLFSHLLGLTDVSVTPSEINSDGIETELNSYTSLIEDAGRMIEAEAESFELLTDLANAVRLYIDVIGIEQTQTLPIDDLLSLVNRAGSGTLTWDRDTSTFAIDATTGDEQVVLSISANVPEGAQHIVLNVEGTIESPNAAIVIAPGSKLQINVIDAATVLAAYQEGDNFDSLNFDGGEILLDVEIAQKATSSVPNPVTFSGMLDAKLDVIDLGSVIRPVEDLGTSFPILFDLQDPSVLDWRFEQQIEFEDLFNFRRGTGHHDPIYSPALTTVTLPDLVSLRGAFTSLEGNAIEASLTVDITNVDEFEDETALTFGQVLKDAVVYELSDDMNTLTETHSAESSPELFQRITQFTPLGEPGSWMVESESSSVVDGQRVVTLKLFYSVRAFDDGSYQIARASVRPLVDGFRDNSITASVTRFTPTGNDEFLRERIFLTSSNTGDIDPVNPVNDNAELVTVDGQILNIENPRSLRTPRFVLAHQDMFLLYSALGRFPEEINNAAAFELQNHERLIKTNGFDRTAYRAQEFDQGFGYRLSGLREMYALEQGRDVSVDVGIVQPRLTNGAAVTVSDDGSTIVTELEAGVRSELSFGIVDFVGFDGSEELFHWRASLVVYDRDVVTHDYVIEYRPDLNSFNMLNISSNHINDPLEANVVQIVKEDDSFGEAIVRQGRGLEADGRLSTVFEEILVNSLSSSTRFQWLSTMDGFGIRPSRISSVLDLYGLNFGFFEIASLETSLFSTSAFFPENLFSTGTLLTNAMAGVGQVALLSSAESRLKIRELIEGIDSSDQTLGGQTFELDTFIIAPENISDDGEIDANGIETEDAFLTGTAALSLRTVLGDYEVDMELSGSKTGFEEGELSLNLAYQLPGETNRRAFTTEVNTTQPDTLVMTNAEGVTLTLTEITDTQGQGEVTLGTITVGDTNEQAARVVVRNGLVLIIYANGTVESL